LEEPEIAPELKAKILQHVEDLKRQKAQYRTRAERHLRAIGPSTLYYLYPVTTHESELTRVAAVRLISEFGDETSIETCLDRLLDPSEFVRDFAHRALERITQQNFGFQASATPRRREMAYSKWRKWWEAEKAELAATEKLKRASRTE
jgi:HEAT repeat protein